MKTYTVQRILFLLIIIHLSYFKLNGQEVDTIKEKVTIVEERRNSLRVYYDNTYFRVPKKKISRDGYTDSFMLEEYCKDYMEGVKDAHLYDQTGFGENLFGFVAPGVSNILTFILSHPVPENNTTLINNITDKSKLNNFAYRKGYKKGYRGNIQEAELCGTLTLVVVAGATLYYIAEYQNNKNPK